MRQVLKYPFDVWGYLADAVAAVFEHHWDDDGPPYDKAPGDPNAYSTGVVGRHNVVLAHMPGMGTVNAAAVASSCRTSFPNIKLALVVGICGVARFGGDNDRQPEIVLGDVVISDAVIQYDLGRQQPDRFVRKFTLLDSLGRPNMEIRALLAKLKVLRDRRALKAKMVNYLDKLRADPDLHAEYPGIQHDRLFEASYSHTRDQASCNELGCDGDLVPRTRLAGDPPQPEVHFGLIASGNTVMKSGAHRDAIVADEHVAAFEMEGAGVWDILPCLVMKGACDYADSHKNKKWQHYAAATAATCIPAFLHSCTTGLPLRYQITHSQAVSPEEAVQSVHSWLLGKPGTWLFIFDGADELDNADGPNFVDIPEYIPGSPRVHVLVTSSSSTTQDPSTFDGVHVRELEEPQAIELFAKCAKLASAEGLYDSLKVIVQKLGYLALAITIAGAYLSQTPTLASNLPQFILEYDRRRRDVLDKLPRKFVDQYTESVMTIWEMSYAAVNRQSPEACRLLTLLAFLDYEDIYLGLFVPNPAIGAICSPSWSSVIQDGPFDLVTLRNSLATLERY
ncbi:nucleoside phosphorylase domain-containing protein [Stachybotrys elegans]|uniref:Nucleoside phosphorylase domain-containing protein n=1 Tax=Stachybotrys elegans TaxID=80388 RepID=A0A8K0WL84_9HYPO|nr:nucleoside phosphorylase domain-containing protein [Stachybotrys elegans]